MSITLLFTGPADPGPFIKHPQWIPLAISGFLVSLVLAVCYLRLRGMYFRRYRCACATWLPVTVVEEIDAQVTKRRSYRREKFEALWKQQSEPKLEWLRRGLLACLIAGYTVWGATVFVIVPRLF